MSAMVTGTPGPGGSGAPPAASPGVPGPVARSAELLSVSLPAASRAIDVVADGAGAAVVSKVLLVPNPTRSTIAGLPVTDPVGGAVNAVVWFARNTVPALALRFTPPVTAGVGRAAPVVPPASATR